MRFLKQEAHEFLKTLKLQKRLAKHLVGGERREGGRGIEGVRWGCINLLNSNLF